MTVIWTEKQSDELVTALEIIAYNMAFSKDKIGNPSILHVLSVANRVFTSPDYTPDAMIVALLHDLVEDTTVTLNFLTGLFRQEIVEAVDSVTRREGETYMEHIDRACENPIGLIVKQADNIDNRARGLPEFVGDYLSADEILGLANRYNKAWKRMQKYKEEHSVV